ncbi:hypothetical protein F1643_14655 [Azospirillum sp. INR13]|nr:hypothetical protein [Azospirillum sp. INR13]MBF5095484.1 hypothetical protein [Azospirillum sp. INR13]
MEKYLVALCFRFSRSTEMKDHEFFNKQKGNASLLIKDAVEWHSETIKNNHGIKESNLEKLFMPYGNGFVGKVSVLSADLDSYAAVRGQYAHTTPSSIQQVPDPDDEKQIASDITNAIAPVDQDFFSCLSSI